MWIHGDDDGVDYVNSFCNYNMTCCWVTNASLWKYYIYSGNMMKSQGPNIIRKHCNFKKVLFL